MPTAPKQHRAHARPPRKAWERRGPDLRKGFRGENRRQAKLRIGARDGWACQQCGKVVSESDSHLDHVVALARGGTHDDDNLQTLCIKCSKAKTARESIESRSSQGSAPPRLRRI